MPAVIFFTMLVVQYALVWHGRHIAESAAQDGLRAARSYRAGPAAGQSAASSYLRQVAPNLLTAPQVTATGTLTTATVEVRATVLAVIPFAAFPVTSVASGPVERFVSGP